MRKYLDWFLLGAKTLYNDMVRCDLFKHASAMAYVMLLSIVPSLAAIFSLISLFSPILEEEGHVLSQIKNLILSNLAAGPGSQVIDYIENLLQNLNFTQIGLTGLAGILVSLILLLRQIEGALNRIWLVKKERNIFARFIHFWTFITLGTFIIALAVGTLTGFDTESFISFSGEGTKALDKTFSQHIFPKLATLAFFCMIYKVVPNTFVPFRYALIGAIPATILFHVAASTYGTFTARFTNYQAVYGALAAIPLFLMWLYILWLIVLGGGVIAWRAQQGFTFKKEIDEKKSVSPREHFKNIQMQYISPALVMAYIYRNFLNARGEGVRAQDIANNLCWPTSWILPALEILEKYNFIIYAEKEIGQGLDSTHESRFFPTIPPHKLEVQHFTESISEEAMNWINTLKHEEALIKSVVDMGRLKAPTGNFEEFLQRLEQTSS